MSGDERGEPTWQPIGMLEVITAHIAEGLEGARDQLELLGPALAQPYRLDDATVQRVTDVFGVQLADLWLWEEQVRRWRAGEHGALTETQSAGVERLATMVAELRSVDEQVLAAAEELSAVTIEKLLAKPDAQVGLEALMGRHSAPPR